MLANCGLAAQSSHRSRGNHWKPAVTGAVAAAVRRAGPRRRPHNHRPWGLPLVRLRTCCAAPAPVRGAPFRAIVSVRVRDDEGRRGSRGVCAKATKRTLWPDGRSTTRRDRHLDLDRQPAAMHRVGTHVLPSSAGNVVTAVDVRGAPPRLAVSHRRRRPPREAEGVITSLCGDVKRLTFDQISGRIFGQRCFFAQLRNFATLPSAHRSEDYGEGQKRDFQVLANRTAGNSVQS